MKRRSLLLCVLSVTALFVVPGMVVSVLIAWAMFCFANCATPGPDRRTIMRLMAYSLLLKVVIFCVLQYFIFSRGMLDIFGDAQDNIIQGTVFGDYFRGEYNIGKVLTLGRYNTHSMSIFNGMYFMVFGADIISLKFLNMIAVTAAGWFIYDLVRRAYCALSGKIAAAIVLFWPTLIMWSVTDLKESHLIFCLALVLWIIQKLGSNMKWPNRIFYMTAFAAFMVYAVFLKHKMMMPVVSLSAVACVYLHLLHRSRKAGNSGRFILYSIFVSAVLFLMYNNNIIGKMMELYGIMHSYYSGSLNTPGWNYKIMDVSAENIYSFGYFVKFAAGGFFHFLTEPLPWHLYSCGLLMMLPLMLIWYFLLFYSLVGVLRLKKLHTIRPFLPMMVFAFLYAASAGMSLVNIGTAIRFRDAIMPVVAILASCAFCMPMENRERP